MADLRINANPDNSGWDSFGSPGGEFDLGFDWTPVELISLLIRFLFGSQISKRKDIEGKSTEDDLATDQTGAIRVAPLLHTDSCSIITSVIVSGSIQSIQLFSCTVFQYGGSPVHNL